ncbi:neprilysin-4 [Drosophila hydei]|uniref:Neprilysin-4 n=1 Tax=Drosophila hydei TaxID=7224 RepID=A0A6J1LU71_DROHY|nr:neprilysin-4 [Drosophila hydei]
MLESGHTRVLLALLLLLALPGQAPGDDNVGFQRVYQTEDTVRQGKAHEMRRHINLRANPCTDFYEYACGNWETETTPQLQAEHRIDTDLQRLLEESAHRKDSGLARQAKEFYQSCLVAEAQRSQQQDFLSEFIQQNGGFPAVPGAKWSAYNREYNWAQISGRLRRQYGMDILIGLRVSYNYASVQENSIYLSEPSTLIPNELCSKRRLNKLHAAYVEIEHLVTEQLKTWLAMGNEESARLAGEIMSLEHELCDAMQGLEPWDAELHLYTSNFTRKTLAELGQLYSLDFETYANNVYEQTVFRPVYMAAPKYYRQLQRTLNTRNATQIANYIMYRAVAALTFPLGDTPERRPALCLDRVKQLLPRALGELYAARYALEESKQQQLLQLYDHLQESLKRSVSADWLEEGSRRIAQRKLSLLQLSMPTYEQPLILKLQFERNNYWHNLRQLMGQVQVLQLKREAEENLPLPADPVEAYETRVIYRPLQRRLELGWALLQPPDYDERYGHAQRYATLGVSLARPLVSAFNELHWSAGLLEHDNWDTLTAWRYQNRSECFARQVEEYLQRNDTATKQLINRSAALNVAFNAYLSWLSLQAPNNDFVRLTKETLPGLNYSNTALFFLAFAQQHCQPKEREQHQLPDSWPTLRYSVRQTHSWPRLAVNGPLRNLAEFAREFHCPTGSAMNPSDKCFIY